MIKIKIAFTNKIGEMSIGKNVKAIQVILKCLLIMAIKSQQLKSYGRMLHNRFSWNTRQRPRIYIFVYILANQRSLTFSLALHNILPATLRKVFLCLC